MDRIAIFAALQWECRAVVTNLRSTRRIRLGEFRGWHGRAFRHEVYVIKTGVGVQRAAAAADALADADAFALLVSTGCAGGLAPELRPGDLIIATVVMGGGVGVGLTDPAQRLRACDCAAAAGLPCREGPIVCSPTALTTAASKRAATASGAIAVDMEGAPIAARAARAGIPFLSVRAILDGADDNLAAPGTVVDSTTGAVRPLALTAYIATHPGVVAQLIALRRMQGIARTHLERFFKRWLAGPEAPA